jgi:hypothetical protein
MSLQYDISVVDKDKFLLLKKYFLMQEPEYDERLSWEGRSDKMIQVRLLGLKITKTINMATKKFGVSGISMNG